MLEVNKIDSLELPKPDVKQELLISNMQFYRTQAQEFVNKSNALRKELAEKYVPKEIEIGKTYTAVKHPADIAAYFSHAPAMYNKLLKDNKLCLYYRNNDFENREAVTKSISLHDINFKFGILLWEITLENPEGKLFTALYATKISPSPYPRIDIDDLHILLEISQLEVPTNIGDHKLYIAKNVDGAVTTFVDSVPADWIVKGTPIIPEDVISWAKFMTHPDSKMQNLDGKVFSLDEWLSYCNAT